MIIMMNIHFCDVTSCGLVEVHFHCVGFEVFTVVTMTSTIFWDATWCSLVNFYQTT
jgi:hypothetical protein